MKLLEIVLIFGVFLSEALTTEICQSENGEMAISEETNILAIFKGPSFIYSCFIEIFYFYTCIKKPKLWPILDQTFRFFSLFCQTYLVFLRAK